jgi:hypothetical protein
MKKILPIVLLGQRARQADRVEAARRRRGGEVERHPRLRRFSHEACGRPFTFWDQRYGYLKGCWKAAENIAWGTGEYSSLRAIFTAWLESSEHRANILGSYREIGIGVNVGELEGNEGAAVTSAERCGSGTWRA